jgi:hypothetical protein
MGPSEPVKKRANIAYMTRIVIEQNSTIEQRTSLRNVHQHTINYTALTWLHLITSSVSLIAQRM